MITALCSILAIRGNMLGNELSHEALVDNTKLFSVIDSKCYLDHKI